MNLETVGRTQNKTSGRAVQQIKRGTPQRRRISKDAVSVAATAEDHKVEGSQDIGVAH